MQIMIHTFQRYTASNDRIICLPPLSPIPFLPPAPEPMLRTGPESWTWVACEYSMETTPLLTLMKLKTLLPTLALLLFAATASAQSDPSTGGSFGTSFNHNAVSGSALAGTVNIGQDASMTAPLPTHRSFWDRMTGRNRTAPQAKAGGAGHDHAWFGTHGTTHHGTNWFHSKAHAQTNNRPGTTPTHTNGWHLFGRR